MMAPSMVIIGYYFKKRLSLANGLSMTGGSIGTMTIPVLFTYVMETYSFQGGMLIYSALLLHIVVAAMLLRPVSSYKPVEDSSNVVVTEKNDFADEAKEREEPEKLVFNDYDFQGGQLAHQKDHLNNGDIDSDYCTSREDVENNKEKELFEEAGSVGQLHDTISRTGSMHSVFQQLPNNQEQLEQNLSEVTASNTQQCTCKSCLMFVYNLYICCINV